jgi:AraC-like DNA-binding protein
VAFRLIMRCIGGVIAGTHAQRFCPDRRAVPIFFLSIATRNAMIMCSAGSACPARRFGGHPIELTGSLLNKIAFSTDDLPAQFDDGARLSEWRDFLHGVFGPLEVSCLPDRPISQCLEVAQFGGALLVRLAGTTDRISTSSGVAATLRPDFFLCFRSDPGPISLSQRGRDVIVDAATAVLGACNDPMDFRAGDRSAFLQLAVPQARLNLIAGVEDLVARPLDSSTAAMRHLRRYLSLLAEPGGPGGPGDDADLIAHIETTLVDLMTLALGAGRDATEIARMRGLRAARLQDILSDIRAGFTNPGYSAHDIACRLGVTPRYVQTLLQETGSSFSGRVLELRLQRVRSMLSDLCCDRMKISEIAEASGFNEISYFNRCFRRRFGLTPTAARGRPETCRA